MPAYVAATTAAVPAHSQSAYPRSPADVAAPDTASHSWYSSASSRTKKSASPSREGDHQGQGGRHRKSALKPIPAKLPASQVTPGAQKAILATRRRSLQMVLRLLAAAAEHWLGNRLNGYLRDPDEYRATTRHLLHLGGTITSTPRLITVTLDPPAAPRIAPRPAHRGDQRNPAPHAGDTRPITYQLAASPRI